ncbi:MAG TPA: DMT family transporter [Candidatus Butyricicoccus stercorigallinarum]|nr:DMT family transporter [Candidatus Butyricicoccus stercorigallinarum]
MSNKTKGIVFITLSTLSFALMNLFVRLSGDLPSMQKSFFRNAVAFVFALVILLRSEEKFQFNHKNLPLLIMRAAFGTIGILCNYYAVDHLLLSDASMLNKLAPFFAVVISYFYLKEKVTPFQISAVIIAFLGALCIIKPGFSSLTTGPALLGALGGFAAGAAYTMVRKLSLHGERGPFIVFFFSAFSCLVCLPYLLFFYHPMTLQQFVLLLFAGLAAAGGQFFITAAYSYAPAREISVFDYSQIVFAALFGFLFFEQIPDFLSVIGYFVICGTSVAMFFYNQKH